MYLYPVFGAVILSYIIICLAAATAPHDWSSTQNIYMHPFAHTPFPTSRRDKVAKSSPPLATRRALTCGVTADLLHSALGNTVRQMSKVLCIHPSWAVIFKV
jgi:hypothetical protein